MRKILIVDFMNTLLRSLAVNANLADERGISTGGFYGALTQLTSKINKHQPDVVVFCSDTRPYYRTTLYPDYKGNHDYLDPNSPFLQFVQHIPNIQWINDPTFISLTPTFETLWLPHSRNPMKDWESILTKKSVQLIFMHQSVIGARTSSDFEINNALDLAWLEAKVRCPVISGDIHVPQQIRSLTYVGTQHPVAYGDDYEYRALLLS